MKDKKETATFFAQSPPAWNGATSPPGRPESSRIQPLQTGPIGSPRVPPGAQSTVKKQPEAERKTEVAQSQGPISNISVLPTSMPEYHRAYMAGKPDPAPRFTPEEQEEIRKQNEEPPHLQSEPEQAATAKRLKPHSRSTVNVAPSAPKPESMTPLHQRKPKPTRWQFGIRSRSQPFEAIVCIYKALQQLGAEWAVDEDGPDDGSDDETPEDSDGDSDHSGGEGRTRSKNRDASSRSIDDGETFGSPLEREPSFSSSQKRRRNRKNSSNNASSLGIQEDPWVIHARVRKDGMYPPGTAPPGSGRSSMVNLAGSEAGRKRSSSSVASLPGSGQESHPGSRLGSISGSATGDLNPGPLSTVGLNEADDSAYVHLMIQLYQLESNYYLVDFKCDGYEKVGQEDCNINEDDDEDHFKQYEHFEGKANMSDRGSTADLSSRRTVDHMTPAKEHKRHGLGRKKDVEKDVSSPFPFMDVASRLIILLAEAD
jgi:carbon catabolite-derepressing protein kinase